MNTDQEILTSSLQAAKLAETAAKNSGLPQLQIDAAKATAIGTMVALQKKTRS